MASNIKVAPSILASDFGRLAEDIQSVEAAGTDLLHVDVMDGHFVPNISIGPCVVAAAAKAATVPLYVHLMIERPQEYFERFIEAGGHSITFHMEIDIPHVGLAETIKESGAIPGVAINPETPASVLEPVRDVVEHVIVMSVHPGFGGQELIRETLPKITEVREMMGPEVSLAVDGGVTTENVSDVIAAGADIIVAGTTVFGADDRAETIRKLRGGDS